MIPAASPASIAADRSLLDRPHTHVREGETRDGIGWIATYVGDRAAFECGSIRHHLLTIEQADAICLWAGVTDAEGVEAAIAKVIG